MRRWFSLKPEWERAHPLPQATLAQVAGHVEHVREVAGVEHVGLGGDFDGTSDVTVGLEDVSAYPALLAELLGRGWTESDCAALAGGNLLRVRREADVLRRPRASLPLARLSFHPMTSDILTAGTVAAGPTVLHASPGARPSPGAHPSPDALALLTWPVLDASGADVGVTARSGGVSSGPYATLNLSLSVGDDPANVLENRRRLAAVVGASPDDFVFARQVHGAGVRVVGEADRGSGAFSLDDAIDGADALVTSWPGVVLAILTADCVPVVLHDPVAGVLACVHAGWRGTVAGVTAAAVVAMQGLGSRPSDIIAGIGPAIAASRYQVGPNVHQAVTQAFGPAATFIHPDVSPGAAPDRWLLDLWAANRHVLREVGVPSPQIHTTTLPTGPTTLASPGYFFSDRTARPCGRLALVARLRDPSQKPMDVTL